MKARTWAVLLCLGSLWLAACGDKETKDGLNKSEVEKATATKGSFHDWDSLELRNGLVRVQVVPQLGGRAMGFEFDGQPLLYANPKLLGKLPGKEAGEHHAWMPGTSTGESPATEPAPSTAPADSGGRAGEQPPAVTAPQPAAADGAVKDVPGGGVEPDQGNQPKAEAGQPAPAVGEAAPPEKPASEGDKAVGDKPMPDAGEVAPDGAKQDGLEGFRYIPSPQAKDYTNYGGQLTWPAPQSHWSKTWPPPQELDLGTYTHKIEQPDGDQVEITVQSPPDKDLGVQLSRKLSLLRASTVLRITETLKNVGDKTRVWSIADLSQHPGALTPGETFTKDAQIYLPLNAESKHHLGFAALLGPQTSDQFTPEDHVLRVDYLGQERMVGADSYAGWMAYADKRHEIVFVKLAYLKPERTYPDQNLTCTVYTAPSENESYLQMAMRSPLDELSPGEESTFTVWYGAAHCPLPLVAASRAGVVNTPLKAEKMEEGVHLTGIFGTFYTGHVQVLFYNLAGEVLARTDAVGVSPLQPVRLDTVAKLPDGAVRAAVVITNDRNADVDTLSDCGISETKPAEKPAITAEKPKEGEQPAAAATGGKPAEGEPAVSGENPREPMPSTGEVPAKPGESPAADGKL
ncbi:MAG: hypothetical protein HYU66_16665 [Armatimonadetes bacterium]|nr:hypothetical protein [Armatimonadota bacterium]